VSPCVGPLLALCGPALEGCIVVTLEIGQSCFKLFRELFNAQEGQSVGAFGFFKDANFSRRFQQKIHDLTNSVHSSTCSIWKRPTQASVAATGRENTNAVSSATDLKTLLADVERRRGRTAVIEDYGALSHKEHVKMSCFRQSDSAVDPFLHSGRQTLLSELRSVFKRDEGVVTSLKERTIVVSTNIDSSDDTFCHSEPERNCSVCSGDTEADSASELNPGSADGTGARASNTMAHRFGVFCNPGDSEIGDTSDEINVEFQGTDAKFAHILSDKIRLRMQA